ncbi:MAG: MBL fold metallo-hydrolase, partial [Candidatus Marinimicrobia bacterium]|nr:MBL fold metallo-hydrolase [Candidatus Neomarinimicrobiota bacterium]
MYNRKVRVLKSIQCTRLLIGFIILFSLTSAQQLEIHHINVGQADATFIKSPTGVTMLIDGGNRNDGTNIIYPYLTSLGVTKLNYIVCSHYHGDHLGGLDEVIYCLGVVNVDTVF